MAEIRTTPPPNPEPAPKRELFDVIFESAFEAVSGAFLVYILGGVALSIAGSFAGGMVPSAPPGFAGSSGGKLHFGINDEDGWEIHGKLPFILLFAAFFGHSLWANYRAPAVGLEKRAAHILENVREKWFGIIIGNAISAWVATLLMGIIPDFSIFHLVWEGAQGIVFPFVRQAAIALLGASTTATVGDWISWYHANDIKLAFWVLYLAGALDDLGVPNIKTLGRWAWRRYQKRNVDTGKPPLTGPVPLRD